MERWLPELIRVAKAVLHLMGVSRDHADDLVQELILALLVAKQEGRIRDPPDRIALLGWVRVVASRMAYWHRPKARRDAGLFVVRDVEQLPGPHPDGPLEARAELRRIERRMKPKQLDRLLADVAGEDPGVTRSAICVYRKRARGRRR
ncbi:hypothetical protein [Polyangium sp. 15x6]|uniref:RNA polymerase sigma factor n=1 Tax=Polyangium sp. 15x6 TaxID=3042687 RepID=UPI00249ACE84|nr:hypothetical protein [Polyangium sp. 15x6]MDI3288059.1 hypothetical protein [Polyangium sp. 15x6]